jgi:hypothetical protein
MTTAQEEGFNIISLVNTKGGAGKSSLAKILVSATLASSRNAFFIDTDITSNLHDWMVRSMAAGMWPQHGDGRHLPRLDDIFTTLEEQVDNNFQGQIFIDTQGEASVDIFRIMENSSIIVIPISLGHDTRETSLEMLDDIKAHIAKLEPDERPVVKLVRTMIPRLSGISKEMRSVFDALGQIPECIEPFVHNHNTIAMWSDEGPLYTMLEAQKKHSVKRMSAQTTTAILQEGVSVLNALMNED